MPKFMNLKKLTEQRAKIQKEMQDMVDAADAEERTLNSAEAEDFEKKEQALKDIDASIRALHAVRDLEEDPEPETRDQEQSTEEDVEKRDIESFDAYIRGDLEERAATNMTKTDTAYTGLSKEELDGHEDITQALFVLVMDMFDNRNLLIDYKSTNLNPAVKTILDMHSVNLL